MQFTNLYWLFSGNGITGPKYIKITITQPVVSIFSWNLHHCILHRKGYLSILKTQCWWKILSGPFCQSRSHIASVCNNYNYIHWSELTFSVSDLHMLLLFLVEPSFPLLSSERYLHTKKGKRNWTHHYLHLLHLHQSFMTVHYIYMQYFIQRMGNLGFPTPKLNFPPSSFTDFCHTLIFLSHPKSIMSPTLPSQKSRVCMKHCTRILRQGFF